MGTPLPPNEPTVGCSLCFGPNPVLGVIQPRYVWVRFIGVLPGSDADHVTGPWPNGAWLLPQVSGCLYRVNWPRHIITLDWVPGETYLRWYDQGASYLFATNVNNGQCATEVVSAFTGGDLMPAYGGKAIIYWDQRGLT